MICCEFVEMVFRSPEPIDTLRNLAIVTAGVSCYWVGAALRTALPCPNGRHPLGQAVVALVMAFVLVPPLLFAASFSTDFEAFAMALLASLLAGAFANKALVCHLNRIGLGL